jgi:acetyl esterase/lipase
VAISNRTLPYTFAVQSGSILDKKPPDPDRRLTYGQDPNQFIDVRLPHGKGPHPTVFFIHGGYWRAKYDLAHAGHLCAALARAGIMSWNIEYRRVGNPGGGWPGTFEDVRAAYRLLLAQKNEIDLTRICVAGHSAGGQLAFCLAAHEKTVSRVFSLAGVLDLQRGWEMHLSNDAVAGFLGGSPKDVPEHYREASPAECPIPQSVQKLIHGTADTSVPYEISKTYADQKKKAGEAVELITLPGVDHFQIIDPGSEVWSKIQAIFIQLLLGSKSARNQTYSIPRI